MNKLLSIILLLLTSITTYCSSKNLDVEFRDKIKKIETSQIKLNKTNDSLSRELLYYKIKEDYYVAALGAETTRFASIISGLLAIIAIASGLVFWKYIPNKINEIKALIDNQKIEFVKHKEIFENNLEESYNVSQHTYALANAVLEEKGDFSTAFIFALKSAYYSDKLSRLNDNENYQNDITLTNLENAEETLKKISNDDIQDLLSDRSYNYIDKTLKVFVDSKSITIKTKAEKINNLLLAKYKIL